MKVSARIEERLFSETDGSCAVCGIKDQRVLTIHHINQDSRKKDNSYDNLLVVCHNCHTSHHEKKGLDASEIKRIKKRLILKTLTQFGVNALKGAKRNSIVSGAPYLLSHLVEMGLLELHGLLMGNDDHPAINEYKITDKGKKLLEKWKL